MEKKVFVHPLRDLETRLGVNRVRGDSPDGFAEVRTEMDRSVTSPSGFMVTSPSGFMVT